MRRLFVSLAVSGMLLAGCSSKSTSSGGALTVFAASSLTKSFTQIGKDFQAANPGVTVTVTFNFGSSSALAGQIESEHTADVFASASGTWMDDVSSKVGVSGRANFATNDLIVITPTSNPAHITSIADLAKPGVKLVLAAKGVPVGDYAMTALTNAGIATKATANVVSYEPDDASVVAKITSGEADAAIVYVSDVSGEAATQVNTIPIPSNITVVATYPIAVVNGTKKASLAQSFVTYVTGAKGQATLKSFGFLSPTG